jgi:hypothetical protein
MTSVGGGAAHVPPVSDWLMLSLRAYAELAHTSAKKWTPKPRPKPSDWVLVFDCETKTTPDQRLRVGAYQVRYKGRLWERGVFYDPAGLDREEIETLRKFILAERPTEDGERIFLRTRAAFVEQVFYCQAFDIGGQIVGLNLPFDISRIAIRHVNARQSMKGGFSFVLTEDKRRPKVAVKHLSARAALFRFTGAKTGRPAASSEAETDRTSSPDRGYFVDLKTLAATLTSSSHSLESLTKLLGVPTEKYATDDHDAPLSADYIRYALRDVQATWECFDVLAKRVASFDLPDVGLYDLYSEASLGKAYLKAMGLRTWREVQPDFPRPLMGQIMSAYFGGRAEVHIRRQVVEVVHCDFLSMYPTVCTLMGLWDFVIGEGVTWSGATTEVRDLVRDISATDLQTQATWRNLTTLVQVKPDADILPVRARYGEALTPNIGLNYLSSDEGLWFTLADVIASKVLSGRSPEILQAVRYAPGPRQTGLRAVTVAEKPFDPAAGDFYRDLIDHRTEVKRLAKQPDADVARLDAEQLAIKILANSTSYGIFMELNVEDRTTAGEMRAYGARPDPLAFISKTVEKPGRYFHPLLGALITGAARLMLALAERQVIDQGLNWAFCDTDSIAIANTAGLPRDEFVRRALAVQAWFADLNPYETPGDVLKVEDVNYPQEGPGDAKGLEPLYCLAISAKRYVLFNRNADGEPVIRKASGHGLGHLMDPYQGSREVAADCIRRVGAPPWQVDVWREIIRAADTDRPDVVSLAHLRGFPEPAMSQYAATTPELLSWFESYNRDKAYAYQVRPFNFMVSLQLASDLALAASEPDILADWGKADAPRPAAPYSRNPTEAAANAFDRKTGGPVDPASLKTLARSLVRYHLHPETKFLGAEDGAVGVLQRRHVGVFGIQATGKEADALEERQFLGEGDADITYPLDGTEFAKLFARVWSLQAQLEISDRELTARAKISHHTLPKLRNAGGSVADATRLIQAIEAYRRERQETVEAKGEILQIAQAQADALGGAAALGNEIGMSRQYVGRILKGDRPVSDTFVRGVMRLWREARGPATAEPAPP